MVHEFFEIHGIWFFFNQCPKSFCNFGLFNRLAQAGGGGAYYMNFHLQKVTTTNYSNIHVYFQYLFMHLSMGQYFWRSCFNLRFKIDVVVMIIWSIVIIINFVLGFDR